MKRPLRSRVWFCRPQRYWTGWSPFVRGGDEYDWHTVMLGWGITGRVIIATHRCSGTGRCAEYPLGPDWPIGRYRCYLCRAEDNGDDGWDCTDERSLCPNCIEKMAEISAHPEGPLAWLRERLLRDGGGSE